MTYTARGEVRSAYFRNCDLAVPGSPISNTLISPRIRCLPVTFSLSMMFPLSFIMMYIQYDNMIIYIDLIILSVAYRSHLLPTKEGHSNSHLYTIVMEDRRSNTAKQSTFKIRICGQLVNLHNDYKYTYKDMIIT